MVSVESRQTRQTRRPAATRERDKRIANTDTCATNRVCCAALARAVPVAVARQARARGLHHGREHGTRNQHGGVMHAARHGCRIIPMHPILRSATAHCARAVRPRSVSPK